MLAALIVTTVLLLAVVAFLCWRLMKIHEEAAVLCGTIAGMLRDPDHADQIAADAADRLGIR